MKKGIETKPKDETTKESMTRRIEQMKGGLLADAWRTAWVGTTWAFELLAGVAARALGGRAALLPSDAPAEPAADRPAPAAASGVVRGTEAGVPMTLWELGLPRDLASEFEAVFRLMGTAEGDLVDGYTFVGPDGVRHPVRLAPANGPDSPSGTGQDLAA